MSLIIHIIYYIILIIIFQYRTCFSLPASVKVDATDTISKLLVDAVTFPDPPLSEADILTTSHLFLPPLSHIIIISCPHHDLYFDIIPDISLPDLQNRQLLDLVIEKGLYLQLVNTELYPVLARDLTKEGRSLVFVRQAATRLRDSGNLVEAASLLAQFTSSSYATLVSSKGFGGFLWQ